MKTLILLVVLVITGCVSTPYEVAVSNFVYEADIANELRVYDRIDQPFYGDCEDFAFTLQKQIGGDVWYTFVEGVPHAVLVVDNVAYDFLYSKRPIGNYPSKLLFILTR